MVHAIGHEENVVPHNWKNSSIVNVLSIFESVMSGKRGAMDKRKLRKTLLLAIKIAVGSSIAIYLAELLNLEYATSAGGITLLTLVTTKWETLKLSLARAVTFIICVLLGYLIFLHLSSDWIGYGLFVFLIVIICDLLGWKATISVNAVIGTHLLGAGSISLELICNEFLLVCIGIVIAIILNLFHDYRFQKQDIIKNMRYTELQLQMILREVAAYLSNKNMQRNLWEDICELENKLKLFVMYAFEYKENSFQSHPGYYIDYFEMRSLQVHILHSLHYELKKIRTMPVQAKVVADFILYMTDYVVEVSVPTDQLEKLYQIIEDMGEEAMPVSREEFESRALLFHILMDIEEFLKAKKEFVEGLDEKQLKMYWNKE